MKTTISCPAVSDLLWIVDCKGNNESLKNNTLVENYYFCVMELTERPPILELSGAEMREKILELEAYISARPDAFFGDTDNCPITNHFAEGVYVREMFVPAGTLITGKISNMEHINILASGKMIVATEDGVKELQGYCTFVGKAGLKKVGLAVTDCFFINAYANPSNTKDIDVLERTLVSGTFEEYETKKLLQ